MNSEELEQSLRAEFESYLGNVVAQMKQDAAEFRSRIESEFERQRAHVDEAIGHFSEQLASRGALDAGFRESVSEHLKLARDEGARIAANAYSEAEQMAPPPAQPGVDLDALQRAVDDISSQDSQSSILRSLVEHAGEFAGRGAFFIIKNEHFAGWKVFGDDGSADAAIREIHFPTSADSILGKAIASCATVEGSFGAYASDPAFLVPLHYGQPDQMYAVPLTARGRGVAVLYADNGGGSPVERAALEMLVKVAGLTVELRASGTADAGTNVQHEETPAPAAADSGFAFNESVSYQGDFPPAAEEPASTPPQFEDPGVEEERPFAPPPAPEPPSTAEYETSGAAMVFDSGGSIEPASTPVSPFERTVEPFEPAGTIGGMSRAIEPVAAEISSPSIPSRARLSERPVDLPIEVPEEERRLHNDARRFARLLVSEIKLYNEKKVLEGRQAHDLYDRLKEAIDRSREMYDKRVQPPVAAKFDYFHYELVNSLGEGDAARLGDNYPGQTA